MNHINATFRGFLAALAATLLMAAARRYVLGPVFAIPFPLMTFLLPVLLVAWLSGLQAGLFATLLGAVAGSYLLIERRDPPTLPNAFLVRLVAFVAVGVLVSFLIYFLRASRRRFDDSHRKAERDAVERREAEAAERVWRQDLAAEMRRREEVETALVEREERMRMAVESANIGTFDFNPVTGERTWSERAKVMFGLAPDADVSNTSFLERMHPDDRERVNRAVQNALDPDGDGIYDIDCRLLLPDGTIRWFIVKGQAFFKGEKPARLAVRFIGTVFEITDRKQAEDAVRASENRLRAIVDNSAALVYLKDAEGRYLMINRHFGEVFGITDEQIIGKRDVDVFPDEMAAKLQANDQQVQSSGQPLEFEELGLHDDGPRTYVSVKFPIKDRHGKVTAVGGISTDISERKRNLDALAAEQELLRHTIEVQDHERQLLTYAIHDGLVQYATGALMQLESIGESVKSLSENHLGEGDSPILLPTILRTVPDRKTGTVPDGSRIGYKSDAIAEQIKNVAAILRRTVDEGRRLINGIRTPVLDDWGVVAAVEHLIDEEDRAHVRVEFVKDEALGRMAPSIEEALFRITQEALTNVRKHSQSTGVRVELGRRGSRVHLEVRDWGVGFAQSNGSTSVHGLRGMTNRARIAGGHCKIVSVPGGGTRVVVDLPFISKH